MIHYAPKVACLNSSLYEAHGVFSACVHIHHNRSVFHAAKGQPYYMLYKKQCAARF